MVWEYVQTGGDVAVYALLYYAHKAHHKIETVEIHQGYLTRRVGRVESKMTEVKSVLGKTQKA